MQSTSRLIRLLVAETRVTTQQLWKTQRKIEELTDIGAALARFLRRDYELTLPYCPRRARRDIAEWYRTAIESADERAFAFPVPTELNLGSALSLVVLGNQETRRHTTLTVLDLEVTRIQIAIELYEGKHEESLTMLGDLVPEFLESVPTDPGDGRPLRFVEGRWVYSVGVDGRDEGGRREASPDDAEEPTFRVSTGCK